MLSFNFSRLSSQEIHKTSSIGARTPTGSVGVRPNRSHASGPRAKQQFSFESYTDRFQLYDFHKMNEKEKQEFFRSLDTVEVLEATNKLALQCGRLKTLNFILTEYLKANAPKMMLGLESLQARKRPATLGSFVQAQEAENEARMRNSRSLAAHKSHIRSTLSVHTTVSQRGGRAGDYRLNAHATTDMTDKVYSKVQARVRELERNARFQLRQVKAQIEEIAFERAELIETKRNFELNFFRDDIDLELLENGTERQIERKFRKFCAHWLKTGKALVGKMRLRMNALGEAIEKMRIDLITKQELSGILTHVDFERMLLRCRDAKISLDETHGVLLGMKNVTGRASLALNNVKLSSNDLDIKIKTIQKRMMNAIKSIKKMEGETQMIERQNRKRVAALQELQEQFDRYDAPSIKQYISLKDECASLDKEEKVLLRKIYIMDIKYKNMIRRRRRRRMSDY